MTTACLVGSTGLVGANVLTELLSSSRIAKVYAYSRKELPTDPKLTALKAAESSQWSSQYPDKTDIFISSLGTTRAAAGGFANQVKIDLDLNLELARAAKAAGTRVYVLISSSGANSSSSIGYPRMKGQLEDGVRELGFERLVILRPGLIAGSRDHLRTAEAVFQGVARFMGSLHRGAKDFWAQDALVIARAAISAGQDALDTKDGSNVRILNQADIIRLGRTEWQS